MVGSISSRELGIVFLTLAVVASPGAAALGVSVQSTDAGTTATLPGSGTAEDPYVISDVDDLQAIEDQTAKHYVLGSDVDASETADWNSGAGFDPIEIFSGTLDGQGHTITGLTIDRPGSEEVGLFKRVVFSDTEVRNLTLADVSISGGNEVGAVAGYIRGGLITDVTISGTVTGGDSTGGVVGVVNAKGRDTYLTDVRSSVSVEGQNSVGGVVGSFAKDDASAQLSQAVSTGPVSGINRVGGVVGYTGVGVQESVATGDVSGSNTVGGLAGTASGTISASYAMGDVTGELNVGGLAGLLDGGLRDVYAVGRVTGDTSTQSGGLAGYADAAVRDGYYDTETTNQSAAFGDTGDSASGGTGLTTAEMTGVDANESLSGLDFENDWAETDEYPVLKWEIEGLDIALADSSILVNETTSATADLLVVGQRTVDVDSVATFGSTNTTVATIDSDREVTPGDVYGTTNITATTAEDGGDVELTVNTPPNVSVVSAQVTRSLATVDNDLGVNVTLQNTGSLAGNKTVTLTANGTAVLNETVRVEGLSEPTKTITWVPQNNETFSLAVDGFDAGVVEVIDGFIIVDKPATNVDDDPLLEDINGDGTANLFDAIAYYNNRNSDAIQNNPAQFDFDGSGDSGTLFDAIALYNSIS